ncbi:carboxypeptidase-like protein S1 [Mollisia scopiformis]|uniref:Carboxypeptidase n=1 Tax=Mollisia scopiformis TaxID=149040 RepID=A0A194XKX3_MOLSC|nr:carboxypeptidase-like protein S1 [Mollisia scopiformis]KUJ20781.1 carboxypeptidase-like protein S1 [Mollisia scopiformis]
MQLHLVTFAVGLLFQAVVSVAAPPSAQELAAFLRGKRSFEERDGVKRTIFEHRATSSKMDFVENSGVCETTPGVNQYSGYFSVGGTKNMWFWFFESRNDPKNAPLAVWINGGPGCSSMIGLFEENGPCQFYNGSSTPSLNPYSWNEYANMLYIDQPVGVGFSYDSAASAPTVVSAPFVWTFMQAFYAQFPQYENRDFGLFTESYGGHFGPGKFSQLFHFSNSAIKAGSVTGQNIDLVALGINNGCYERLILEKSQIDYLYSNSYYPLINASTHASLLHVLETNATAPLEKCANGGTDAECVFANVNCILNVDNPMGEAADPNSTLDWYDIRQHGNNTVPPSTYINYLSDPAIMKAIGAQINYTECPNPAHDLFSSTGDPEARSQLPELSAVVQSGVQTVMFAGDADVVCNWFGGLVVADSLDWHGKKEFGSKKVENYTVDGAVGGTFKNVDNLSWLRVFNAGHEVPYFRKWPWIEEMRVVLTVHVEPALALQVFKQTMQKKALRHT